MAENEHSTDQINVSVCASFYRKYVTKHSKLVVVYA